MIGPFNAVEISILIQMELLMNYHSHFSRAQGIFPHWPSVQLISLRLITTPGLASNIFTIVYHNST